MQLDIFDNSEGFKPRTYGKITFSKLSLHEKINLKGYYQYMPWNLPYHDGHLSHYSYNETRYDYYVKNGLTDNLANYYFEALRYHYKDYVYYQIEQKKKKYEKSEMSNKASRST